MNKKFFILLGILQVAMLCGVLVFGQTRYSVVISELMADPTPQVGLPNTEWLELRNTTGATINLQNWRLAKTTGVSGPMPVYNLLPDSCVIICTGAQVPVLQAFGRAIAVTSFPSLSNDADLVWLVNPAGALVHAVDYNVSWYQNAIKADGGWTLEMIDIRNPCAGGSNWRASNDLRGGSPGIINSINGSNRDAVSPRLLRGSAPDSVTIVLSFDEPLDSASAIGLAKYSISNGIGSPVAVSVAGPLFSRVNLRLASPILRGTIYSVQATGIADCSGNTMANTAVRVGLASVADSLDLVVNELMFDPPPLGFDYIELYNRSNKIIDLRTIILANRSSTTAAIGSLTPLSANSYLLFPGEYVAASQNPAVVGQTYTVNNPDAFLTLASLPSFPDDKGNAIVLNNLGRIVDELRYDDNWHFALLNNKRGVALERQDPNRPTNSPENWTSAASTAGFGTPTAQNSQFLSTQQVQGEMSVSPKMFSPDNDGFEDFALLNFKFPQAGYVANVTIFDAAGRPVRVLQRNTTCAAAGSFRWDGLDDKMLKVPVGTYIIYTDIFEMSGKKKRFKNTVVVARKF
ncbi:MAG: hypothetical protein EAY75_07425 [Bacteroidetes bacterium]|nr:MAG: hypothetical protein EAY75_07425 [Bacteroidota bacterium]